MISEIGREISEIIKNLKKMANFANFKKYRDQQFILRKSAGNQLFAAFLVTYEIGREIGKFLKILKKWLIF